MMNYKNYFFILGVFLILMVCISAVSAEKNMTDSILSEENSFDGILVEENDDSELQSFDNDNNSILAISNEKQDVLQLPDTFYNDDEFEDEFGYSISVIANDVNANCGSNDKFSIKFIKTSSNEPLSNLKVEVTLSQDLGGGNAVEEIFKGTTNSNGVFTFSLNKMWVGTFSVSTRLVVNKNDNSGYYKDDFAKVIISKGYATVITSKLRGTTKSSTLRAIVKNSAGKKIDLGSVKFKINGKTYQVAIYNGVATIKIKLSKAKTYTYTATYSGKYYYTKSSSSKLIVKKSKNWYKFKAGKYTCKLSFKQYMKLLNAKNSGKDAFVSIKTGKYYNCKKPVYKSKKVKKTKWVYKKKLARADWWDDSGSEWEEYNPKTPKGYTWYGTSYKSGDGWSKVYYKYKKKVTYTTTKKVKAGYKKTACPVYMYVETIHKDSLVKKGDYVRAWVDSGVDMGKYLAKKKINLYKY